MTCLTDCHFKYFIKKVLKQFAMDFMLPPDILVPVMQCPHSVMMTEQYIQTFAKALWFKANVSAIIWRPFVVEYSSDILESDESYVRSVLYMCKVVNGGTRKVEESFISVIATVVSTAAAYFHSNDVAFIRFTAPILITYFENVMKKQFYQNGGWAKLYPYVHALEYLKWYPLRNTSQVENIVGKYAKEIQQHVDATDYVDNIEFIVPDTVKKESLCKRLSKKVMDYNAQLMENLERSSGETPMQTADSETVPSTSGIDAVEISKESSESSQASVPVGAQSTEMQTVDNPENSSKSSSLEAPIETADSEADPSTSGIDVEETSEETGELSQTYVPAGAQTTELQTVDNPENSSKSESLEAPMETADSEADENKSGMDAVEASKGKGGVSVVAQNYPLQTVDFSKSPETSSQTLDPPLQENVKSKGKIRRSSQVGILSSKAKGSQSSVEQSQPVVKEKGTSSSTDHSELTEAQRSVLREARLLFHQMENEADRLLQVIQNITPK